MKEHPLKFPNFLFAKEIPLRKKPLLIASIAYLWIPVAIFLYGWTNFLIASVCAGASGWAVFRMFQDYAGDDSGSETHINTGALIFLSLFLLVVGYYSGWGRFVTQSYDWQKHNAILKDLVYKRWPVYYRVGSEESMLVYYIAQYLVPALAGKLAHSFRVAEVAYYIWAEFALFLVILNLIRIIPVVHPLKQCAAAPLVTFFSPPLPAAQWTLYFFYNQFAPGDTNWLTLDAYNGKQQILLQYTSNYVLLRSVSPQTLAIWIALLLFLEHRNQARHYVTLFLPVMLFASLPFLGIAFIAFTYALFLLVTKKLRLTEMFSRENLLTVLTSGSLFLCYFAGNVLSEKPAAYRLKLLPYGEYRSFYLIFTLCMVVLPMLCVEWENKKNPLFCISFALLMLVPLFSMGRNNDFVMRCSIPGLFLMMYYTGDFLNRHANAELFKRPLCGKLKERLSVCLLCACLMMGLSPQVKLLKQTVQSDNIRALGKETNVAMADWATRKAGNSYYYFSFDLGDDLFVRYCARVKP